MATCDISIDTFQRENGDLDVIDKYNKLMTATLGEDSLYTRGKETIFHQFEDLQLTEKEKAALAVDFVTKVTAQLSQTSMTMALTWVKDELEAPYALAKIKAETENVHATFEKIKEEICLLRKEDELRCIQIEAAGAASLRDNGSVKEYKLGDDGQESCHPLTLENEGLKYFQTKQVEADSYRIFADSYRKSGVVVVGIDNTDGIYKGLTGTTNSQYGEVAGYTAQQSANAERQRIAYEDSKINHAANSSASMIGQMLSAEVAPAEADVNRWRSAVDRLLSRHSTTSSG